ncbi:MAG: tetratricopeptide repeat protein [Gemmataceae bacterium]|nr:tetratricopeptide repeat protein [Gemmataceae bacterium]MCI0737541.1 tetratricopeptide repeat protein [Gemmataceae bacterium]
MSQPSASRIVSGSATQTETKSYRSAGEEILSHAQESREIVQDFVPLAESLEWELGQQYLRDRGNKAFISDFSPVPFVINNDGTLSRHAAEVFFASLVEAEKEAPLENDLFVLELGIGVGLFARYFLDNLQELCRQHKKDYYDRLCYIAADKSERMLLDVCRHGVLSNHPGRYRLRLVDAMKPHESLPHDVMFRSQPGKPLRAVFLNYLLDCLPATVLQRESDQYKQLCVRTCVGRNVKLEDFTDMTVTALQERAKSNDPRARHELLEVYGLFASEYDYRPVDLHSIPYHELAQHFLNTRANRLLHNWGAIECLERLLDLVHESGFILANDYGQTQVSRDDEFEHQRFSLATFVGVNFSLLNHHFGEGGKVAWVEPMGETGHIHARLLGHKPGLETKQKFQQLFGAAHHELLQEPLQKARACVKVGRFELAASFYNQALDRQPGNWVLLNEVAMFLIFSLRDVKAGIDMAKVALRLNPTLSAELWDTLGDGLFEYGRYIEARSAYHRALQVNGSDVRARYNLAWTHQREKNYPAALEALAEGLALDKTGEYSERLLHKQQEVLAQLAMRHQQEYLLLVNLVSKYAKKDEEKPKAE